MRRWVTFVRSFGLLSGGILIGTLGLQTTDLSDKLKLPARVKRTHLSHVLLLHVVIVDVGLLGAEILIITELGHVLVDSTEGHRRMSPIPLLLRLSLQL